MRCADIDAWACLCKEQQSTQSSTDKLISLRCQKTEFFLGQLETGETILSDGTPRQTVQDLLICLLFLGSHNLFCCCAAHTLAQAQQKPFPQVVSCSEARRALAVLPWTAQGWLGGIAGLNKSIARALRPNESLETVQDVHAFMDAAIEMD